MPKFINLSNHSSDKWGAAQRSAAEVYGNIVDIPFPQIDPKADSYGIDGLVSKYLGIILENEAAAVMLQGEFVFTYRLVRALKERGIKVLSACSERRVVERVDAEGKTQRVSEFEFVQFREY